MVKAANLSCRSFSKLYLAERLSLEAKHSPCWRGGREGLPQAPKGPNHCFVGSCRLLPLGTGPGLEGGLPHLLASLLQGALY